jgi:hypothetical protein
MKLRPSPVTDAKNIATQTSPAATGGVIGSDPALNDITATVTTMNMPSAFNA